MRSLNNYSSLPTNGRHPVWIALLLGLLVGQVFTLLELMFQNNLVTGFSGSIPGWQAIVYNAIGAAASILILFGIYLQRGTSTVKRFVSALLVEQYSSLLLGITVLAYAFHSLAKPGNSFPFILLCLGVGLFLRTWQIRRELKEIQLDLAVASRMQQKASEAISNFTEEHTVSAGRE